MGEDEGKQTNTRDIGHIYYSSCDPPSWIAHYLEYVSRGKLYLRIVATGW